MKKWPFNLIFAACFLFLIQIQLGCGSKQTARESSQPDTSADSTPLTDPVQRDVAGGASVPSVPKGPVIVAFGDSLTAGVNGRSYPDQLQDLLTKAHYRYRVENQGVSGETSGDGLARLPNVISIRPALVILEFGGNDGLRGLPVEETKKNLAAMIEQIQAAKLPLVLLGITLPPNYGPDYVKSFTDMFPNLAKEYKIPIMPFLLLHVYRNAGLMQPDGIHPNEKGNTLVAQDVFELIQPLLKRTE